MKDCQTSNISRIFVGNSIVDHSVVVGASPAALLQLHLHSKLNPWFQWVRAETTARRDKKHLNVGIWCVLYKKFNGRCCDRMFMQTAAYHCKNTRYFSFIFHVGYAEINMLFLTHWDRVKIANDIWYAFSWMKVHEFRIRFHSLTFVPKVRNNNIPALVQIMAWRDKATNHYLNKRRLVYRRIHIYAPPGLNELNAYSREQLAAYIYSSFLVHNFPSDPARI